jgi:hypothetical protein
MKILLPILLLACTPKTPEVRGLSLHAPSADAESTGAPMMSAYTTSEPPRLVVHVADTAFDGAQTGWSGDRDLVTDIQYKNLDDGIGLFSRIEIFMAPDLEQYSYGLPGSADNVWVRINSGDRELVLTLHPLDMTPSPNLAYGPAPDPGPPLDLEYWYVSVETLLKYLEEEAGVWVYYEPEIETPSVALSVVGKGLKWRGVAGLIHSSLSEHGFTLEIDGWSVLLHRTESTPEAWTPPPWASENDGRPPAPSTEAAPSEESAEGAQSEEGEEGTEPAEGTE